MLSHSNTAHNAHEEDLVRRAVEGNEEAFEHLYTLHLDVIYRYIFFRVEDAAEAEDLTEEVFIKAWQALPKYRAGEYPFASWLYRIAHNLTINHQRKQQAQPLRDLDVNLASLSESVEEMVAQRQNIHALKQAIQQLEDEEQQVILLRFVEGLSHQEVAASIGKSNAASRVIQHRALDKLSKYLR
jgi:RNA polymerase sigma-70 factor (ECF subfamily)